MSIDKIGQNLAFRLLAEQGQKPQFQAGELEELQELLDESGVLYTVERVPANELTMATESDLSKEVVKEKLENIEEDGKVKPVVVSEEYDIIDGRHQTRAIGEALGKDHKTPVLRVHLPTSEAMGMLSDMQNRLNEQDGEVMDVVAVFSGRFQPFHRGHYEVYQHLVDRFGRNKVFIGTSDKVEPPRSPFTFRQKKQIITGLFDVPHEHVVEVSNPYAPKEVLNDYDSDTTAYVAAVSEKDKGRLLGSDYFDEYTGEDLVGYEEGGYVYTTPMAGFSFRGQEISGTLVRETFRSDDIPEEEKKDFFRYIYGTFDQNIYDMMTKRLSESKIVPGELLEHFIRDRGGRLSQRLSSFKSRIDEATINAFQGNMVDDGPTTWYSTMDEYTETMQSVAEVFGYEVLDFITDRVDTDFKEDGLPFDTFYPAGIDRQGIDNPVELYRSFSEAVAEVAGYELLSYMGDVDPDLAASLNQYENIAIPLGGGGGGVGISAEEFEVDTDADPEDRAESESAEIFEESKRKNDLSRLVESVKKKLMTEGGGHGHMNHPFEDLDLNFGDVKNMINLAFEGELDIEEQPVEKVDGQNLMVSWIDGDLRAARNKGHLRNFGENSMDLGALVKKFEGRGEIREAFEYAFRDLSVALSRVRNERLQEVFENGKRWMSLEVIYPAAKNVVEYGESFIVFHGVIEYDENANALDFKKDAAYNLADMVQEVNANVQEEFEILSPPEVELPQIQLEDLRSELIGRVEDYMSEYDLSNDDKVLEWHEKYWENFVREKADEYDYDVPEHVVAGFIRRWAWGNKSGEDGYSVRDMKSAIENEDFLAWARDFDKTDYEEQFKENMKPLEEVFLRLGTEVLKRIETVLATDPDATRQDIKDQMQSVRAQLEGAADKDKIEKLQSELERLEKAGGIDEMAALEGIVFQYDGKTYKLTGQFAPINQLVGIMKYGR